MKRFLRLALPSLAAFWSLSSWAADAVTNAMQSAYIPYRTALFRTNSPSQAEAQKAIEQAQQAWRTLGDRFAAHPPAPYDRDADFGATLSKVAAVYDQAAEETRAGKLKEAHETLETVRDLLAGLRQRNGVVVYSDRMNAFHAEMERLLGEGPRLLSAPQGLQLLTAQAGVLSYLTQQLRVQAPIALQGDAEFHALLKDLEDAVQGLREATLRQDAAALKDAMSRLKAPYSKLFLKFG